VERTHAGGPVTLKDVAQASGVSISTVSRILDDRTPASRSETAQRVRRVAE
jgi:LacI family transcriptional regulator